MDPLTLVLMILRVVLLVHALPNIVSADISFVAGVRSVYGVSLIAGFFGRGNIETSLMVLQFNTFWSKITLLV